MKKGKRLYINITNKCNVECPFCCMYSNPSNNRFMSFDTFKRIVDETENYISFRGYPTIAKSLFGWELIDMSDYGVTVYLEDGYVKAVFLFPPSLPLRTMETSPTETPASFAMSFMVNLFILACRHVNKIFTKII